MGLQVAASKRKYEIGACTDLNDIQPNCIPAKNPRIDDSHLTTTTTTTSTSSSTSESTSTSTSVTLVDVTFVHQMHDDSCSNGIESPMNGHEMTSCLANTETTSNSLTSRENGSLVGTNETRAKSTKQPQEVPQLTGRGHELTLAKLNTVSIPTSNPAGNWSNGGTDDDETVIDPISKLQAVAVPDEAWGGGAETTRSTLATTLLPPDDLDEDIDDFEDDFDDDDVMLPSYGPPPVAYRGVPSSKEYTPPSFPKYPSEQYHNQNCSRTPTATAAAYNRYGSLNNIQYYHNEPMPISDPPQTIRCAENGKSYTELGTYTFFNSNTTRHIKRCCDGKNNWCNNKQCYKEKRIRMMNLSMFKLSRFRQASDQSLYRSVLICNTLKEIEEEIEEEKRQIRAQLNKIAIENIIAGNRLRNSPVTPQKPPQQQQQQPTSDYASGPHSIISSSNDSNSNVSYRGVNGVIDPVSDITTNHNNEQKRNEYSENNPNSSNTNSNLLNNGSNYLQSHTNHNRMYGGSLTGFESIPPPPQPYEYHPLKDPQSGRATPFPASNGYPSTDSGYGGDEGDMSPDGQFRSINWGSVLSLSSQSALDPLNNNELFPPHTSPHYITSNSCGSSFNTASSLSSNTTTTNYLDMDLGYDVLPNCYKLTSFGSDDFLKTPLMEPSKVVYDGHDNNMPDTFSTHIMVGS